MAKIKKPAPKGGKKAAAPKKVVKPQDKHARALKRAIKKAESAIAASEASNKVWSELAASVMAGSNVGASTLTERQADQIAADKMRADSFASTQSVADAGEFVAPLHPTVEEQFDRDASLMQALHDPENQPSQYGTVPMSYLDKKPSLLRRAINRVKRAFRFRSAKSGEYVTPEYAAANPDTTVREKA